MKYWLNLGGEKTYGPYEVDRLRIFQSEGKLGASAQLCQEGGMQWVPAASVLGPTNTVAPPRLRQSTVSAPLGVQVGVQGEFELAPFGKRAGAIIIDGLILSMGNWLIDRVALEFVANVLGSWERASFILALLELVIGWLYFVLLETSQKQATLGKMLVEIKVTDINGNRLGFGQATGRYFSKMISMIILGVGFLFPLWTPRKQALHDIIAGTLVLRGARV